MRELLEQTESVLNILVAQATGGSETTPNILACGKSSYHTRH
jgi:hypothetical protein